MEQLEFDFGKAYRLYDLQVRLRIVDSWKHRIMRGDLVWW